MISSIRAPLVTLVAVLSYVGLAVLFGHRTLLPDEIRPLLLTQQPLAAQLEAIRADLVQTPLFNLAARGWFALTGPTDAAAKGLVVGINAAAIAAFAALAGRVGGGARVATLIAGLAYLRVGSSMTLVRMYGLAVLLVILALLAWDRWWRSGSRWSGFAWALAMTGAVYTHASAGLLLPAFVLAGWPSNRRLPSIGLALVPVAALAGWVPFVLDHIASRGFGANVQALLQDPWRAFARIPFEWLSGEDPGGSSPRLLMDQWANGLPLRWVALLLHLGLAIALLRLIRRDQLRLPSHWVRFLPIAVLTPPLILLGLSLLWRPVVSSRYLLIALPAYWLLLASLRIDRSRLGPGLLAIAVGWLAVSAAATWPVHWERSPVRTAVDSVAAGWQPRDLLLLGNHYPAGYQAYWEWRWRLRHPGRVLVREPEPWIVPWLVNVLPHGPLVPGALTGAERIWLLTSSRERRASSSLLLAEVGYRLTVGDPDRGLLTRFEREPEFRDPRGQ